MSEGQEPTPKLRDYDDIVKKDPRTSPVYTIMIGTKRVSWVRKYPQRQDGAVTMCAKLHAGCNTCVSRARDLSRYYGPGSAGPDGRPGPSGPSFFAGENVTADESINKLIELSNENCVGDDYTLVLVTNDTFPSTNFTGPGKTGVFSHWTITPSSVTESSLVPRMKGLWSDVIYSCRGRLAKLLTDGARRSIDIMQEIIELGGCAATSEHPKYDLKRPEYWADTLVWIRQIHAKFTKNFDAMTPEQKEELYVFAMASGHASPDHKVHYNYKTASSIIDFLEYSSKYDVAHEMDKRSDPRTNQVSAVAQAEAARISKGVTGNSRNIALVWDGIKNPDDLDLRGSFFFKGKPYTVYYGNKNVMHFDGTPLAKLDFDAGIMGRGQDKAPVENISIFDALSGVPIKIEVDNYYRKTVNEDVPFSIVISQLGRDDIVIDLVWPKDRVCGHYLHVTDHIFPKIDDAKVELSESQARAAAAQDQEFKRIFGVPTSTIATVDDLEKEGFLTHRLTVRSGSVSSGSGAASALGAFDRLVSSGLRPKTDAKPTKKYLSDHLAEAPPGTISELCAAIESGKVSTVKVHLQDHPPGYVTKVEAESSDAFMSGKPAALVTCFYDQKHRQPLLEITEKGTARLNETWVHSDMDGKVAVRAISVIQGKAFLVLDGAHLTTDTDAFPLCAGFSPHILSTPGHKHRSKWAFLNVSVTPQMPTSESPPAIGTFVTGETTTLYVDGKLLVLRV